MILKKTVNTIEIDSVPNRIFEFSNDWSGLSLTRLFSRPLFYESNNRDIQPDLIEKLVRQDQLLWRATICKNARWSNGQPITAHDVYRQIRNIIDSQGVAYPLVLHLKTIKVISTYSLDIVTRMPIAQLSRLLSNPAFSPRSESNSVTSGLFRCISWSKKKVVVESVKKSFLLNFIPHSEHKKQHINILLSGPMTTPTSLWSTLANQSNVHLFEMDMMYILDVPKWITQNYYQGFIDAINRKELGSATNGIILPCKYLTDTWNPYLIEEDFNEQINKHYFDINKIKKIPLLYTNFLGNKETALSLCTQISSNGIRLIPNLCDYTDYLSNNVNEKALKLCILSSLWPHPSSLLTPFRFSNEVSTDFKKKYDDSLNEDDLEKAKRLAFNAEELLDLEALGIIPLGKIKGCFVSQNTINWWPPSGWMDVNFFSKILL